MANGVSIRYFPKYALGQLHPRLANIHSVCSLMAYNAKHWGTLMTQKNPRMTQIF